MDEVDVEPVDIGDEVRIGEELRLGTTPVVVVRPIIRDLLHSRELDALSVVVDRLAFRPTRDRDAPFEVGELLIGRSIVEGPDRAIATRLCGRRSTDEQGTCDAAL